MSGAQHIDHGIDVHDWDVDNSTAFLPHLPPISRLPPEYDVWERLLDAAAALPLPLAAGTSPSDVHDAIVSDWHDQLKSMPLLDARPLFQSEVLLRRSHLVLAFLLHFFVHSAPVSSPTVSIPRPLSVPLLHISSHMQLPPVLTYSDTVLYNWSLIDRDAPVSEDNIKMNTTLSGTADEAHFYLTSALIELRGARALDLMRASTNEAFVADATAVRRVTDYLNRLADVIGQLAEILGRVAPDCNPDIFYHRIRPWLAGLDSSVVGTEWYFEGASELGFTPPVELSGPSAGQSSLIHALDIFLSVDHNSHSAIPDGHHNPFLERMKLYMPRHHRAFLNHLSYEAQSIRDFVLASRDERLLTAFNSAICQLKLFRDQHIRIVALYIVVPASSSPSSPSTQFIKGTGGTNVLPFLKDIRNRTGSSLLSFTNQFPT